LRSATASWSDLVDIAAELPSRDAAMILAGVMDAADTIPEIDRAKVIEIGLASGSGTVRLAALPALAALEGPEVARERSAADASAKVRAWAATPRKPARLALEDPPDPGSDHEPAATRQRLPHPGDQPTLF